MANKRTHPQHCIKVRDHLYEKRVFMYELAEALGISVSSLLIRFRKEQPEEIQQHWIEVIDQIAAQNAVN